MRQGIQPDVAQWQKTGRWADLAIQMAKSRDLVSLKILEKVYLSPGYPLSLIELRRYLRNVTRNKMTIWSHIKKLEELGLVTVVRGKLLFVFPKKEIPVQSIRRTVKLCYSYLLGVNV